MHSAVNDDDPYRTGSQLEIRRLLRSIEARKSLLRMHLKGRAVAVVTTILDIDTANNRLIVDVSNDTDLNERLIGAEEVTFDTMLDKIHIQFSTGSIAACVHDNLPALSMAIPETLSRIQRREFYRVDVPIINPATCTFTLKTDNGTSQATLAVKDISGGGVSVIDTDRALDNAKGTTYPNCKLHMPEAGDIVADLRIMRSQEESLASGGERRVVGCRFISLPNPMQIIVQHYIGMIERKENAKRRGFD